MRKIFSAFNITHSEFFSEELFSSILSEERQDIIRENEHYLESLTQAKRKLIRNNKTDKRPGGNFRRFS